MIPVNCTLPIAIHRIRQHNETRTKFGTLAINLCLALRDRLTRKVVVEIVQIVTYQHHNAITSAHVLSPVFFARSRALLSNHDCIFAHVRKTELLQVCYRSCLLWLATISDVENMNSATISIVEKFNCAWDSAGFSTITPLLPCLRSVRSA